MKKRKFNYLMLLLGVLFLSLSFNTKANAKTTKKNWYKPIITCTYKNCIIKTKGKKINVWDYYQYRLLDINKDGTKELLLRGSSNSSLSDNPARYLLLSYYKGEIYSKYLGKKSASAWLYYNSKKKELVWEDSFSVRNVSLNTLKIKKGKIVKTHKLDIHYPYYYSNPKCHYEYDGKKISEKKAFSLISKKGKEVKKFKNMVRVG